MVLYQSGLPSLAIAGHLHLFRPLCTGLFRSGRSGCSYWVDPSHLPAAIAFSSCGVVRFDIQAWWWPLLQHYLCTTGVYVLLGVLNGTVASSTGGDFVPPLLSLSVSLRASPYQMASITDGWLHWWISAGHCVPPLFSLFISLPVSAGRRHLKVLNIFHYP